MVTSIRIPAAVAAMRVNRSLTAAVEKRILVWMAERAPHWLTPDHLTSLGFGAQIAAGACFALSSFNRLALLGTVFCITLNWLGDSLDGTLARVRNQQRPRFGFYVDHMVDIFGSVALMVGLACSRLVHSQIAIAMLVAFIVLASESFLATNSLSMFEMSQGFFGPTEIRILLIAGTLAALRSPFSVIAGHRFLLFDVGGIIATIAMLATAIVKTARHTAQLYREEPIP